MIIKVYGDRLFLERYDPDSTEDKGYILPEYTLEKPMIGKVLHIGEDVKDTKVGDVVMFEEFEHREVLINSVKYVLTKEESLICKLNLKDE